MSSAASRTALSLSSSSSLLLSPSALEGLAEAAEAALTTAAVGVVENEKAGTGAAAAPLFVGLNENPPTAAAGAVPVVSVVVLGKLNEKPPTAGDAAGEAEAPKRGRAGVVALAPKRGAAGDIGGALGEALAAPNRGLFESQFVVDVFIDVFVVEKVEVAATFSWPIAL